MSRIAHPRPHASSPTPADRGGFHRPVCQEQHNLVAAVMAEGHLVARPRRRCRCRCLTRQDAAAGKAPDLLRRDLTPPPLPNQVAGFVDEYNHTRRHSTADMLPPAVFEATHPNGRDRPAPDTHPQRP